MDKQLGYSTVSTITGFLIDTVFGNVENDELLQKAIKYGEPLTELDKSTIIANYSLQTTSIINSNMEFRNIFWEELFSWIDTQKKLTTDPGVLAKRLLPVNPEGGYYPEAFRNFNKFGDQTVKAFEFYLINKEIDLRHGKDSQDAKNDKDKLKKGELILIRNRNGKFDYYAQPEIRRALESVKKSSDFFSKLQTAETEKGICAISFNPLQARAKGAPEIKSTVLDLNKEIWASKRVLVEKHMAEVGIYVDGSLKVDNGVASGRVVDNKGTKLKLEVSVIKPGKKVYKFTFVDRPTAGRPARNFSLTEDQLQDHFVNNKRSALEVFTLVQRDKERQRRVLPVTQSVAKPKKSAKGKAELEVKSKQNAEPIKSQLDAPKPVEPPPAPVMTGVTIVSDSTGTRTTKAETYAGKSKHKGPMDAKKAFEADYNQSGKKAKSGQLPGGATNRVQRQNKGKGSEKPKNGVFKVMKWYAATGAGVGAAVTGVIFTT